MSAIQLLGPLDANFAWDGNRVCSQSDFRPMLDAPVNLRGAAASVEAGPSGAWRLLRDPLGINKLFWAYGTEGAVLMAARPHLLVAAGSHMEEIRAIPAGSVVDLSPRSSPEKQSLVPTAWFATREESSVQVEDLARSIRATLDGYLSALAVAFPDAEAFVCLSGGLDSTGIAVLVREYFRNTVAVSFDLQGPNSEVMSEDRQVARRLARDLDLPLLEVNATEDQLFETIDTVLLEGIDWRDFNVHAGLVNAVLAQAIDEAVTDRKAIVFTGDLANEFLADYEAEQYRGKTYYRLPRLPVSSLRNYLVRGLDTSHREIGVFAAWGLPVVQPYAAAIDDYMMLGDHFLRSEDPKQRLNRAIFQDLVPEYVYSRAKVRAQVGNPEAGGGVLAACVDRGFDSNWLRRRFAMLHSVTDVSLLDGFIRAGRYASAVPSLDIRIEA